MRDRIAGTMMRDGGVFYLQTTSTAILPFSFLGNDLVSVPYSLLQLEKVSVGHKLSIRIQLETESWLVGQVDTTVLGQYFVGEQVPEGGSDGLAVVRVGL
jgi:hypothetical protein